MNVFSKPAVRTHIISGFLGAGKTTLLQHLLSQKPEHEVWAVLMNEFGQIGVDQQLLTQEANFVVKELLGGCLCCSSQLPMQLALSRLIHEHQPDRLFIEPTGLGHPAQLLDQLTEPYWQPTLQLQALVTVIDGSRLNDAAWTSQSLYQDQLKAAQIVVVSHHDHMHQADFQALDDLKADYLAKISRWILAEQGQVALAEIDHALRPINRKIQPLIYLQKQSQANTALQQTTSEQAQPILQLPYHYTESAQGYAVAGWRLSKRKQFDFYALLDLLTEQQDWLRIKAIFNTNQGWHSFNFNPDRFNYQSCAENIDNRIEIIGHTAWDCASFELALLKCQLD